MFTSNLSLFFSLRAPRRPRPFHDVGRVCQARLLSHCHSHFHQSTRHKLGTCRSMGSNNVDPEITTIVRRYSEKVAEDMPNNSVAQALGVWEEQEKITENQGIDWRDWLRLARFPPKASKDVPNTTLFLRDGSCVGCRKQRSRRGWILEYKVFNVCGMF